MAAAISTEDWIEELKGISVLELSGRIKALEEEFGVSATAVAAAAPAGVFYGCQTLAQLIEHTAKQPGDIRLAAVTIDDAPPIGWRGLMRDVQVQHLPLAPDR